jgi:hypothetical protein
MAENDNLLQCPLCQGHGHISQAEIISRLSDRELKAKIDRYLAGVTGPGEEPKAMAAVGPAVSHTRDFEKEVHDWNPQTPIWRRSPKE